MPDDLRTTATRYGIDVTAVKRGLTTGTKTKAKDKGAIKKPVVRGKKKSADVAPEAKPADSDQAEAADANDAAPTTAPWPDPTTESMAAREQEAQRSAPPARPEDAQGRPGTPGPGTAGARAPNA